MNGQPDVLAVVKSLHELATRHDILLEFVWRPKKSEVIKYVDGLSRIIDTSDFSLANRDYVRLCQQSGWLTGDAFARSAHSFHKGSRFFSLYYCHYWGHWG